MYLTNIVKYWYPEYRKNLSKLIRNTTQQKQWSKETNKNFTEEEERMDNKIDQYSQDDKEGTRQCTDNSRNG